MIHTYTSGRQVGVFRRKGDISYMEDLNIKQLTLADDNKCKENF
jgi:hypothetical protein